MLRGNYNLLACAPWHLQTEITQEQNSEENTNRKIQRKTLFFKILKLRHRQRTRILANILTMPVKGLRSWLTALTLLYEKGQIEEEIFDFPKLKSNVFKGIYLISENKSSKKWRTTVNFWYVMCNSWIANSNSNLMAKLNGHCSKKSLCRIEKEIKNLRKTY